MPKITYEQEEEYRRLKSQRDVLDHAISMMISFDAAMRVLVKHDLLQEFADEVRSTPRDNQQKREVP